MCARTFLSQLGRGEDGRWVGGREGGEDGCMKGEGKRGEERVEVREGEGKDGQEVVCGSCVRAYMTLPWWWLMVRCG